MRIFLVILVGQVAALRRRQQAVTVGKERRESLVRAKRLCRSSGDGDVLVPDSDMMVDEEQSVLDAQTYSAVDELMASVSFQCVTCILLLIFIKILLNMFACGFIMSIINLMFAAVAGQSGKE